MRQHNLLEALSNFAEALLEEHTLDDLLWRMASELGHLLELEDCVIYLIDGDFLIQAAAYGVKNPTRHTIVEPIAIPIGEGIVGTVAATRRGEVVQDTRQDARYIADQFDGASELAVPMICAGTLLGVIDSEADTVEAYAESDLQIFQAFANVAAGRVASLRSERQHRETEATRQRQRLEALGKLAGGVAHDFNNLLTVIGMHTSLAAEASTGSDDQHASLEVVLQAVERARGLTHQLTSFTGGSAPKRAEVDIVPLLDEALAGLRPDSGIVVSRQVAPRLPPVWADADQLSRVMHNLIRNALQAMQDQGTLTVDVSLRDGVGGRMVALSVSDTGPGVPAHLRERVFDPYFTTRREGTGLGLASSYWILRRHGGDLLLTDSDSGGACFCMMVPAFHARAVRSSIEPSHTLPSVRVLVLEDEPEIAAGIRQMLERRGHDCTVVSMGQEVVPAWIRARRRDQPYDVVLLDLIQPTGVGGRAALARLRAVPANVPVVLMSGHTDDDTLQAFASLGAQAVIHKPFRPGALLETLGRALQEPMGGKQAAAQADTG